MKKFVSHESSASDFACTIYFLIRNDQKESECLVEDFEKQATLELNPKIFQFSKIISDFEVILEGFINVDESGIEDPEYLTADQLRQIVKDVLPKVEKYFTDGI
nr:hypothetical protein orf103a [Schizostauron trachyderma]